MKSLTLFLFLFLFSAAMASQAFAYVPTEINASYATTDLNLRGLACTNNTGTFYCYTMQFNSANHHLILYRYNSTWGDKTTCDTGCVGSCAETYWKGISVLNTTHLIAAQCSNPSSSYLCEYRLIPVNMTSCAQTGSLTPKFNATLNIPASLWNGGYYTGGYIYWGAGNGVRDTDNNFTELAYWSDTVTSVRLPNQADNSTLFGYYDDVFFKYSGGAFDSYLYNPSTVWGFDIYTTLWDMWTETPSTTWLYVLDSTAPGVGRLYKANFSVFEEIGDNYITAVSPIGNVTTSDTTPTMHAIVYSAYNGTVGWTVDGSFKSNQTLITDGVSADAYYTASTLSPGAHTWSATFYPSAGYSFSTGTQSFNVGLATFIENPAFATAGIVGAWFGIDDQDTANNMFSIIAALVVSVVIMILVVMYSGKAQPSGNSLILVFVVAFMAVLIAFTIAGMLNPFYTVVFVVVSALGMWAIFGKLGG